MWINSTKYFRESSFHAIRLKTCKTFETFETLVLFTQVSGCLRKLTLIFFENLQHCNNCQIIPNKFGYFEKLQMMLKNEKQK